MAAHARVHRVIAALLAVACGACNDGGGDGSGTTTSGGGTSSGGDSDPVGECEQAATPEACAAAQASGCAWIEVRHVAREGSTCTLLDAFGACLRSTAPEDGCVSPPGCEIAEDPYIWFQPDGTAWSMTTCGGPHPVGWMHCESGQPDAEPPICTCACSLAL